MDFCYISLLLLVSALTQVYHQILNPSYLAVQADSVIVTELRHTVFSPQTLCSLHSTALSGFYMLFGNGHCTNVHIPKCAQH